MSEQLTEAPADVVLPTPDANQGPKTENAAVSQNRTAVRAPRQKMWIAPGGMLQPVQPFTATRYNLNADGDVLGNPESMLKQEWKDAHFGWHYAWPIRQSNSTSAYIRAQWYIPIPFDAIDGLNPMAAVAEVSTPAGKFVIWKQHLLVGIPPEPWRQLVEGFERLGIDRAMSRSSAASQEIDSEFGRGGFYADPRESGFSNSRASRTGE